MAKKKKVKSPIALPQDQSAWPDYIESIAPGKANYKKHRTLATLVAIQERIDTDKATRTRYLADIKAARLKGETRKKQRHVGVVHLFGKKLKGAVKARAAAVLEIARDESISAAAVLKYLNKHGEAAFLKNKGAEPPPKAKPLSKKQVKKTRDSWVASGQWHGNVSLSGKAPRKKKGPVLIFGHQDGTRQVRVLDAVRADDSFFLKLLRDHSKRLKAGKKAKPEAAAKLKPKPSTAASKKTGFNIPGLEHLTGQSSKG